MRISNIIIVFLLTSSRLIIFHIVHSRVFIFVNQMKIADFDRIPLNTFQRLTSKGFKFTGEEFVAMSVAIQTEESWLWHWHMIREHGKLQLTFSVNGLLP